MRLRAEHVAVTDADGGSKLAFVSQRRTDRFGKAIKVHILRRCGVK
jgi:hypothetical protein